MVYQFSHVDEYNSTNCWFLVTDNSIYEIMIAYQDGSISHNCIKININHSLFVQLNNYNEYIFIPDEKYHLILIENGIEMYFLINEYVCNLYWPDLTKKIDEKTWKEIYGNRFKQSWIKPMIDQTIEYDEDKHLNTFYMDELHDLDYIDQLDQLNYIDEYEYNDDFIRYTYPMTDDSDEEYEDVDECDEYFSEYDEYEY